MPPKGFKTTFMALKLLKMDSKYHPESSKLFSWTLNDSKSLPNTTLRLWNYFHGAWMAWNRLQIPSKDFKTTFMNLEWLKIDSKYHDEASNLLSWYLVSLESIPNTIPPLQNSFHHPWIAQNRFRILPRGFEIPFMELDWLKKDSKYHPKASKLLYWSFNGSKLIKIPSGGFEIT